jgi:hypothetical protein
MYFVFADDAKQNRPSRQRMGPLVAAGAILVHADRLQHLETSIEKLELWMWSNLTVADRKRFSSP